MNLELAPKSGVMYALYKDRVEYRNYNLNDLQADSKLNDNLLELHLFDKDSEYRIVQSGRGKIEVCINDSNTRFDDKYIERVYTNQNYDTCRQVEVVNYITYDENDLAVINNYRLKEVE